MEWLSGVTRKCLPGISSSSAHYQHGCVIFLEGLALTWLIILGGLPRRWSTAELISRNWSAAIAPRLSGSPFGRKHGALIKSLFIILLIWVAQKKKKKKNIKHFGSWSNCSSSSSHLINKSLSVQPVPLSKPRTLSGQKLVCGESVNSWTPWRLKHLDLWLLFFFVVSNALFLSPAPCPTPSPPRSTPPHLPLPTHAPVCLSGGRFISWLNTVHFLQPLNLMVRVSSASAAAGAAQHSRVVGGKGGWRWEGGWRFCGAVYQRRDAAQVLFTPSPWVLPDKHWPTLLSH